jgi:hypothetical protein
MKTCNCWKAAGEAAFIWGYLNSMKIRPEFNSLDKDEIQMLLNKLQMIIDICNGKEVENNAVS